MTNGHMSSVRDLILYSPTKSSRLYEYAHKKRDSTTRFWIVLQSFIYILINVLETIFSVFFEVSHIFCVTHTLSKSIFTRSIKTQQQANVSTYKKTFFNNIGQFKK